MWPHLYRCGNNPVSIFSPPLRTMLQCGRIYIDAEIARRSAIARWHCDRLQCGRIYIDAEMIEALKTSACKVYGFNVAASI